MQQMLEKQVKEYCDRHQMLERGDRVVLGVSGGADSVCLLFVLLALRSELDLVLHVVHVNHGIRKEAGEDAAYVRALCGAHQVPFYLYEKDIPALAKKWNCSEEEAGRRVRYEAFEEVLRQQHCQKIAVAHNSNDRAETMLFHLFRGTGLTGLAGIRPKRGQIIRPLLCLNRMQIEAYLAEQQIQYRHDCTNDSDDYTRNKIRHHILSYAEEEIVQGSVANMARTADILEETENYIEEQVQKALVSCVTGQDIRGTVYCIRRQPFLQEHALIQKRRILRLLKELSPMHKDIGAVHVEEVLSLVLQEGNREVHLPYGIRGSREYEEIVWERETEEGMADTFEAMIINPANLSQQEYMIAGPKGSKVIFSVLNCGKDGINCEDIPENQYTKWFDYDKIKECLVFRTRKSGDYFCIKGSEGMQHKKLKDYMIAEKIPRKRRDELPLVAVDNHVLWLVGYRISEYYKVDENTKNILQICYKQTNRL